MLKLLRRVGFWIRSRRHADNLAAELEHHRAQTQAALQAGGLTPSDAAAASRRAMGNMALAREDARDVWIAGGIERIWRDAVYGARALRREPAFAFTALLTLTLGIATTTTVFTIADAELWKPLPFPRPAQLVAVQARSPGTPGRSESVPAPDFLDWQAQARLAEYAAEGSYERRVLRRNTAEGVTVQAVTANYFQVFGVAPRIGRAFVPGQDDRGRVAILSDRGWRRLFNAAPEVAGLTVSIDDADVAIVGALADQHFELGTEPDLFVVFDPSAGDLRDRSKRALTVIGRVRDGSAVTQADAELQALAARIAEAYPDRAGHTVRLRELRGVFTANNWRPLFFFLGAAAIVLLLSCANVANLLLARALRRRREFAIRGALGGGRGALVRQLLVEGALLVVPSAAAGTLLSLWGLRLFVTQIPSDLLGRGGHFALDARIAAFVILISAITTVLMSLAPLFFARRIELNLMLGQGGRAAGRTPGQLRARHALLLTQLTMTLILMVAAGLFVTSFARLVDAPLGFEPEGRLSLRLGLPASRYAGDAPIRAYVDRLLDTARATPGVVEAAVASSSPLMSGPLMRLAAAERTRPAPGDEAQSIVRAVTPDYFSALGIRLVTGRPFSTADVAGAPRVAILNEYLAAQLFPGQSAVGRPIELLPGSRIGWTNRPGIVVVVGVIAHVKDAGVNEVEFGNVYLPFAQAPSPAVDLIVQTSIPPGGLATALRAAAASVDRTLPVARVETLPDRVRGSLESDRFNLALIVSFAVVAILLAAVGIYGAMACAVQERTREFGVRLALGQPPASILRGAVWRAARFGITGAVLGLTISVVIARLIGNALYLVRGQHNGLLYGVSTTDPAALIGAAAVMVLIATVSGLIPARQATNVDPLVVLRSE